MDKEIALENLKLAVEALKSLNIKYWLEAGTCLGAWREHDFIDHDLDIDLGIVAEDCDTIIKVDDLKFEMLKRGFTIHHTFGEIDLGMEIAFKRKGVKLDVFWFYLKDDKRWHAAWKNGGRNGIEDLIKLVFPARLFENLGDVRFLGNTFKVPNPTVEYLEARYGLEWMIPNKNWNWATDPKCINEKFEI